ncbi:MAG: hypothetical protein GX051_03780 [Clostridiales bacterium]|nr:hypothetical protein [Clostridiales bacterium]
MFHSFKNQEERRAFGGSAFIELQYCKMNIGAPEKKIISVNSLNHWQDDSLYVFIDDIDDFYNNYSSIFTDGLYNNMQHGEIDVFAVNYYTPLQITEIIKNIESTHPADYSVLLNWLKCSIAYNGVYILGI